MHPWEVPSIANMLYHLLPFKDPGTLPTLLSLYRQTSPQAAAPVSSYCVGFPHQPYHRHCLEKVARDHHVAKCVGYPKGSSWMTLRHQLAEGSLPLSLLSPLSSLPPCPRQQSVSLLTPHLFVGSFFSELHPRPSSLLTASSSPS